MNDGIQLYPSYKKMIPGHHKIILLQGIYYFLTGIWPLVHLHSFLLITGWKTDLWLVKTFSIIIMCLGAGYCIAGFQKERNFPVLFLSITTAASLAYVDIYYSLSGIISDIYLADAIIEVLFLSLLVIFYKK